MSSKGHKGPTGLPSVKTKIWVAQPHIRTFFWERDSYSRMIKRMLEEDDELVKWCHTYRCKIQDTWIECPDDKTMTLFMMKWM